MVTIFVDGDACPVKAEVERVAERHGLDVVIVSNGGLRPSRNPRVRHEYVPEGADAADDRIVALIGNGDVAITADIPLAARCLEKGASVLGPNGRAFTEGTIGTALTMRTLNQAVREATRSETFHAPFSKQDRSRFLSALENAVQSLRRSRK